MSKEADNYLQELSQNIFNLQSIIEAYVKEPVKADKALHKFFITGKENLISILKKPKVAMTIGNPNEYLSESFLLTTYQSDIIKKEIEKASWYLRESLNKVQKKRQYKSLPTTGITDSKLQKYITEVIAKKRSELTSLPNLQVNRKAKGKIIKQAGKLNLREGGAICYGNKIIEMGPQMKTLSELFINKPNQIINRDDIYDELQPNTKNKKATVAKYVSELNRKLKPFFKENPIVNNKKEGWSFHP